MIDDLEAVGELFDIKLSTISPSTPKAIIAFLKTTGCNRERKESNGPHTKTNRKIAQIGRKIRCHR